MKRGHRHCVAKIGQTFDEKVFLLDLVAALELIRPKVVIHGGAAPRPDV